MGEGGRSGGGELQHWCFEIIKPLKARFEISILVWLLVFGNWIGKLFAVLAHHIGIVSVIFGRIRNIGIRHYKACLKVSFLISHLWSMHEACMITNSWWIQPKCMWISYNKRHPHGILNIYFHLTTSAKQYYQKYTNRPLGHFFAHFLHFGKLTPCIGHCAQKYTNRSRLAKPR